MGPATQALSEAQLVCLRGFDPAELTELGTSLADGGMAVSDDITQASLCVAKADVTAPADIFDSGSMADATPSFTGAVRSLAERGHDKPADVAFSLGLEALIAGLGALRG